MLPRPFRLTRQQDFSRVYRRGISAVYPAFVLHRKKTAGQTRFGFSVSKKLGHAVVRNRVRRRLRHGVYELYHLFPEGFDYVFVARTGAVDMEWQELLQQLRRAARAAAKAQGGPYGRLP